MRRINQGGCYNSDPKHSEDDKSEREVARGTWRSEYHLGRGAAKKGGHRSGEETEPERNIHGNEKDNKTMEARHGAGEL